MSIGGEFVPNRPMVDAASTKVDYGAKRRELTNLTKGVEVLKGKFDEIAQLKSKKSSFFRGGKSEEKIEAAVQHVKKISSNIEQKISKMSHLSGLIENVDRACEQEDEEFDLKLPSQLIEELKDYQESFELLRSNLRNKDNVKDLFDSVSKKITAIGDRIKKISSKRDQVIGKQSKSKTSDSGVAFSPPRRRKFKAAFIGDAVAGYGSELGRGAFGRVLEVHLLGDILRANKVLKESRSFQSVLASEQIQFCRENQLGAAALKQVAPTGDPKKDAELRADFERECEMAAKMPHSEHILSQFPVEIGGELCLLSEKCTPLLTILKSGQLKPLDKARIISDIAEGLDDLHDERLIHEDLAARNIVLYQDPKGNWRAKIADPGRMRELEKGKTQGKGDTTSGPLKWFAPERGRDNLFSRETDMYAFGILILEILTDGREPFADKDPTQVLTNVQLERLKAADQISPPEKGTVMSRLYDVMVAATSYDPSDRPTAEDIVVELSDLV